jgi:hypothetical protein
MARRLADDPFFLAAALASYARGEGLDDAALAAKLECDMPTLTMLRLCRAPRAEAPHFGRDVETIAARFGVSADLLAEMARRGQALLQMRPQEPGQGQAPGLLMAARDDEAPAPDKPEGSS